jgi:hypothetical protein
VFGPVPVDPTLAGDAKQRAKSYYTTAPVTPHVIHGYVMAKARATVDLPGLKC